MPAQAETALQKTYPAALMGPALLLVWLLAFADVLTTESHFTQFDPGLRLHPVNMVAFSAIISLSLLRRQKNQLAVLPQISAAVTLLLTGLAITRGFQAHFIGEHTGLDAIFGSVETTAHASWYCLSILALLNAVDGILMRANRTSLAWGAYLVTVLTIWIALHQVWKIFSINGDQIFAPHASLLFALLTVAFAAFSFVNSPAAKLIFNKKAPSTNFLGALVFVGVLWVICLVTADRHLHETGLSLAHILLAGLPILVIPFQAREKSSSMKTSRARQNGSALLPEKSAGPVITPKGLQECLSAYFTFHAPERLRLLAQGGITFALAFTAIWLGQFIGQDNPPIWWASAYLAYCLILRPYRQWLSTLTVFYLSVIGAYAFFHTGFDTAALLTLVHLIEGALLGLTIIAMHGMTLDGRKVVANLFELPKIAIGSVLWLVVLTMTSSLIGVIRTEHFGGDLWTNAVDWASSAAVGTAVMISLLAGKLVKLHFGYEDLSPRDRRYYVVLALYFVVFFALFALVPPLRFGNIVFALMTLPLVILPSLLQAASVLFITTAFLRVSISLQWENTDTLPQFFIVTVILIFIVSFSLLGRYHFARLRASERRALEYAPSALLTLGPDLEIHSISKNEELWFDKPFDELEGTPLLDLFDNRKALRARVKKCFETDANGHFNVIGKRTTTSGEELFLQISLQGNDDPSLSYHCVASIWDVSQSEKLETAMAQKEEIVKAFMEGGPQYFAIETSDYKTIAVSQAVAEDILGVEAEDIVGKDTSEFGPEAPEAVQERRSAEEIALATEGKAVTEFIFVKNGSSEVRHMRAHIRRVDRENGDYFRTIVTEDVTELTKALNSANAMLNADTTAFIVQDENFDNFFISDRATEILGYDQENFPQVLSMLPDITQGELDSQKKWLSKRITGKIHSGKRPVKLLTASGKDIYAILHFRWFPNPTGEGRLLWISIEDVSKLIDTQNKLSDMVDHDELTGLWSRRGMLSRFSDGLRKKDAALFLFDLDHFKSVNDSFGHEAGDDLLIACGNAVSRLVTETGCAVRLGGEEFALIKPWVSWQDAEKFGETIRDVIESTAIEHGGRTISRTASIGYTLLAKDANLSDAMHLADLAQREAKETGRNKVIAADEELLDSLRSRGVFITRDEVRRALFRGELRYHVQPIWDVDARKIAGFEALIRWHKPDGTMVMPNLFVDLLREIIRDPVCRLEKDKIRKRALAKLVDFPDAYVSFNFTLDQLSYEGAAQDLIEQFADIKDTPSRVIKIELSEHAMDARTNSDILHHEIEMLHDAGFLIALDDFGIESSNLHRLQEFPIDTVKVDKVLIDKVENSEVQRTTLKGLVHTMQELGIHVIAEGVETREQAILLKEMGIFCQQGYLHARPMPPENVMPGIAAIGADLS